MSITLIENFRAAFYAPFYAACALGAYKDEGLDVVVEPSSDFTRTIENLVSGEGEVSWGGPLRLMAGLERKSARKPVAFCEVVGKDPFFLVGRKANPDFRLTDLLAVTFGAVIEVPTPWLCLKHDMRLAAIDSARVKLARERTMADNAAALRAGEVDVIQVFQPYAKALQLSGAGHIWYAAATRGATSYTTLNTTREYAAENPQTLVAMCRAMYRTQKWMHARDGRALAELVADYFPNEKPATLAAAFDDYLKLGLWNDTPVMSGEGLDWLCDAGVGGGFLRRKHDYDEVADMRFAQEAMATC